MPPLRYAASLPGIAFGERLRSREGAKAEEVLSLASCESTTFARRAMPGRLDA
jgi:hypothetical protein